MSARARSLTDVVFDMATSFATWLTLILKLHSCQTPRNQFPLDCGPPSALAAGLSQLGGFQSRHRKILAVDDHQLFALLLVQEVNETQGHHVRRHRVSPTPDERQDVFEVRALRDGVTL